FLDASLDCRTRRRAAELAAKGMPADFEQLREEIRDRDEKSRTRADSPLRRADDAVLVDSTDLTADQVVDALVALARKRL
ncbi:MAG TPA: (d)CMP kinase, partial [Candidatus Hydrogenedentes bacterium]|nr:(d)CMP kinase [Candidatus Hydrogenedentota bacterium]